MTTGAPESGRHLGPVAVPCSTAALASVRTLVEEFATSNGATPEFTGDLMLAVDEVCSNIVTHAFPDPPPPGAGFTVECTAREGAIDVVIRDRGLEFDVSNAAAPAVSEWLARGKKGGIGLKLIRMLVDNVSYKRVDGVNEVVISKRHPGVLSS